MDRLTRHIAVLCDYRLLPERVGGMDLFFVRFDAACKAEGIEVDWFFPDAASHAGYDALAIVACPEGIEAGFLSYSEDNLLRYTHVVTHFLEIATPFYRKLRKRTGAKIICIDHNPRPLRGYSLKKKLLKRLKGVFFSRYIDAFVGVSDYTTREIIRDFGGHIRPKCSTVYNGIDLDAIPARKQRHIPPRFLVASHLRPSKGIQDLLEAVALLPDDVRSKVRIDVYGEGPMAPFLQQRIKRLELADSVVLKGSSPELKSSYCHYDYMLQPTHMECFSLSILESLAANVPVITTPVGGNPEVIRHGHNGLMFPVADVRALAEIITRIIKGEVRFDENIRTIVVQRFSLQAMVGNHLKLIR